MQEVKLSISVGPFVSLANISRLMEVDPTLASLSSMCFLELVVDQSVASIERSGEDVIHLRPKRDFCARHVQNSGVDLLFFHVL